MALELIVGPMFSGKTSLLISKVEIFSLTGKKCVILRSSTDTRTKTLKTHSSIVYTGNVITLPNLEDLSELSCFDVIGIDEGHFFDGKELLNLIDVFLKMGKNIFVAMLKSTYNREPFPYSEWFYTRATAITLCKAVCEICKEYSATNTRRKNDDHSTTLVGGKELYFPCCDKCYFFLKHGSVIT